MHEQQTMTQDFSFDIKSSTRQYQFQVLGTISVVVAFEQATDGRVWPRLGWGIGGGDVSAMISSPELNGAVSIRAEKVSGKYYNVSLELSTRFQTLI